MDEGLQQTDEYYAQPNDAGISMVVSFHLLRYSYAVPVLKKGVTSVHQVFCLLILKPSCRAVGAGKEEQLIIIADRKDALWKSGW